MRNGRRRMRSCRTRLRSSAPVRESVAITHTPPPHIPSPYQLSEPGVTFATAHVGGKSWVRLVDTISDVQLYIRWLDVLHHLASDFHLRLQPLHMDSQTPATTADKAPETTMDTKSDANVEEGSIMEKARSASETYNATMSLDPVAERKLVWKFDLRLMPTLAIM